MAQRVLLALLLAGALGPQAGAGGKAPTPDAPRTYSAAEQEQEQFRECPGGGEAGASGSCKPKALVSILTPTREATQHRHRLLHLCFSHQTYPNKQLIILDDSPLPSPFFTSLSDPAVQYIHVKEQLPLGAKRNRLADAANGTILVHFDDDDFYSPTYVAAMVAEMRRTKAALVKLSGWYSYSCKIGFFGYWDPGETAVFGEVGDDKYKYSLFLDPRDPIVQTWVMGPSDGYDTKLRDETRYGFGFSYVYKRSLARKVRFDMNKTFGEDLDWVGRVLQSKAKVAHFADRLGLALHLQGSWNTARIPLQYRIPNFLLGSAVHPSAVGFTQACGVGGGGGVGDSGG